MLYVVRTIDFRGDMYVQGKTTDKKEAEKLAKECGGFICEYEE